MNWQSKFSDHTTGIAFSLTLSKSMVRELQSFALGYTGVYGHFPSFQALRARGLIEGIEGQIGARITPAGELAWKLVCMAAGQAETHQPGQQTHQSEAA